MCDQLPRPLGKELSGPGLGKCPTSWLSTKRSLKLEKLISRGIIPQLAFALWTNVAHFVQIAWSSVPQRANV